MDELATLRSENILFKAQVNTLRTEMDELKTENAALKVDVSYWNERYVNARTPACMRSQCKAACTLAMISEEVVEEAVAWEKEQARYWKARAYTLYDLFTADGWVLMVEAAEKEGRQSTYWQGIYIDGCDTMRRMGREIPSVPTE
jgi:hypothetical protein